MLGAIFSGLKWFFSACAGGFHYLLLGIGLIWAMFSYAFNILNGLPAWIGGICIVCLIVAIIKLILGR